MRIDIQRLENLLVERTALRGAIAGLRDSQDDNRDRLTNFERHILRTRQAGTSQLFERDLIRARNGDTDNIDHGARITYEAERDIARIRATIADINAQLTPLNAKAAALNTLVTACRKHAADGGFANHPAVALAD